MRLNYEKRKDKKRHFALNTGDNIGQLSPAFSNAGLFLNSIQKEF